jgi:hypothetical protein
VAAEAPALLHVVGYLTGASLYAMLLAMVVMTRGAGYRLTLTTALLGVAWNVGELAAHAFAGAGMPLVARWVSAISFVALGFLASVVVHSSGHRSSPDEEGYPSRRLRQVALAGYVCAGAAGIMQLFAAATGRPLPWSPGLLVMTVGLAALSIALLLTTRHQPQGRRALWMTALALFAVSALHLGQFHGASEGWITELLGHHASIPLAFAILYQDYRFGFADLFLKRALTFIVLVALVFLAWSSLAPWLTTAPGDPIAVGVLLAVWMITALAFPRLKGYVSAFVDRVLLHRTDYTGVIDRFSVRLQACDSEPAVLETTAAAIRDAFNADAVHWCTADDGTDHPRRVAVPTAEMPQYVLELGSLQGGRRLFSDDMVTLERMALLAARRVDAVRLQDERYERMLREREISALATEAELRALRAQMNPHFLFNALTTVGYLIQEAPARALDTLMRLTTLLRSSLRSEGEFTTLGHERKLLECYLQIERERFEERLEAAIDVPEALAILTIPSLIVQPLVENAIKHGIAPSRTGGRVTVAARRDWTADGAPLRITVINTGVPLQGRQPHPEEGIGLHNVEHRLRCYYGDAARVTLTTGARGETIAEIVLPVTSTQSDDARPLVEEVTWPT